MRDSVTVSIAAEIIGTCREIDEVSLVFRSTSAGRTADSAGNKSTSSKVSASGIESLAIRDTRERLYINDSWISNLFQNRESQYFFGFNKSSD